MKQTIYSYGFFYLILILGVLVIFFGNTHSYFADSVNSLNNIFTATNTFPSSSGVLASSSPVASASASPTVSPTPTPNPLQNIANHLVISEVQIDGGPSKADHDFIELYNPTNADINISNYRLVSRTGNSQNDNLIKAFNTGSIVKSHGYYLWASSHNSLFPNSIGADAFTDDQLTNGMSVGLRNGANDTGILIDGIGWNSGNIIFVEGTPFVNAPGDNQSLERKAYFDSSIGSMSIEGIHEFKGNGYDLDNNADDFVLRLSSQPQNSGSAIETP